jgi:hypothetical protein
VQIEDMRRGVHEHLPLGEGEIDFPPVLAALHAAGYPGLVSVELPRHSHTAATAARHSIEFLHRAATAPTTTPAPAPAGDARVRAGGAGAPARPAAAVPKEVTLP